MVCEARAPGSQGRFSRFIGGTRQVAGFVRIIGQIEQLFGAVAAEPDVFFFSVGEPLGGVAVQDMLAVEKLANRLVTVACGGKLFTRIGAGSDSDGNVVQPFGGQIVAVLVYNRQLPFGQGEPFDQVMNFLFDTYMTEQGGDPDAVPVTDGLVLHLNGSNAVMDNGAVTQFTDMSGRDNHAPVLSDEDSIQIDWIAEDGMWNVPENWDPELVPRSFGEALFLNGGTMTVGDDWTLGTIDIEGESHLIVEAGATLPTTGDDGSNQTFKIRRDGGGTLTLFGHVIAANHAQFGRGDIADEDFATVEIDGGSFVAEDNVILTQNRAGAEFTLRNEAFIQAGGQFAEWGPTSDFHFRMDKGTSLRQGDDEDGILRFASWVNDGKVEFLGENLGAYVRVETIDGEEWAVLTVVHESEAGLPQVISWDNPGEGSWDVVENWDPQVLPGNLDEAEIFNGGTVTRRQRLGARHGGYSPRQQLDRRGQRQPDPYRPRRFEPESEAAGRGQSTDGLRTRANERGRIRSRQCRRWRCGECVDRWRQCGFLWDDHSVARVFFVRVHSHERRDDAG